MKLGRNVIYVEKDGKFEFFSSPAALESSHPSDELGISRGSLNNLFCKLSKENKPEECRTKNGYLIRRGEIVVNEKSEKE